MVSPLDHDSTTLNRSNDDKTEKGTAKTTSWTAEFGF